MAEKILPIYPNEVIQYRLWDNISDPELNTTKDYFISASNKEFIFKSKNSEPSYLRLDFWGLDNLYYYNNSGTFTTKTTF